MQRCFYFLILLPQESIRHNPTAVSTTFVIPGLFRLCNSGQSSAEDTALVALWLSIAHTGACVSTFSGLGKMQKTKASVIHQGQ